MKVTLEELETLHQYLKATLGIEDLKVSEAHELHSILKEKMNDFITDKRGLVLTQEELENHFFILDSRIKDVFRQAKKDNTKIKGGDITLTLYADGDVVERDYFDLPTEITVQNVNKFIESAKKLTHYHKVIVNIEKEYYVYDDGEWMPSETDITGITLFYTSK